MPATITTFHTAVTQTTITSSDWNGNFDSFRGTRIPIHPSTATADTSQSYDLGTAEYRWRYGYVDRIYLGQTTTSWNLEDDTTTSGDLVFKKNGVEVARIDESTGFPSGGGSTSQIVLRAYKSANLSCTNIVTTNYSLDTATTDPFTGFGTATSNYTIQTAGTYQMTFKSGFATTSTGDRWAKIQVDNSTVADSISRATIDYNTKHSAFVTLSLTSSQVVRCQVLQSSGGNINALAGPLDSYFEIIKL